jgi:hypothetical protein
MRPIVSNAVAETEAALQGVQETVANLAAVAATPAAALGFAIFLLLVRIPNLRPHALERSGAVFVKAQAGAGD